MKRQIPVSRRKRLRYGLGVGVSVALVLLLIWAAGLFNSLRLRLNNAHYTPHPTSDTVVIVAIDNASLEKYGRISEWSRTLHAELIDTLNAGGARVVVFDVLFAEPSRNPSADEAFAASILAARQSEARTRVVMPISGESEQPSHDYTLRYAAFIRPIPLLAEHVAHFGFVNIKADDDGFLRWQPLRATSTLTDTASTELSLAGAAYLAYLGIPYSATDQVVTREGTTLHIAQRAIPLDEQGRMLINFYGRPEADESFAVYSYQDVLEGRIDPAVFAGKIVLVGAMNATGITDTYPVPLGLGGENMAGVAIHANALETILQDEFLTVQSRPSQAALIVIFAIVASLLYTQLRWRWIAVMAGGLAVLWLGGALFYFNGGFTLVGWEVYRHMLNLFDPLLAIILPAPAALAVSTYLESERRRWAELLLESAITASSQQIEFKSVLATVAEDVHGIIPSRTVQIWLWDAVLDRLTLAHNLAESVTISPAQRDLVNTAFQTQTFQDNTLLTAVPLNWQDKPLGVIAALRHQKTTLNQRQLLELFAWQTASIIANAELYSEAAELSEMKTRMIRMASHDLKNPIGAIMGYIEILREDQNDTAFLNADQERYIGAIMAAANQMDTIVKDILNLERVRSGRLNMIEYELTELVQNAALHFEMQAQAKGQTLTATIPRTFAPMVGDYAQVREAIHNLVGNAIKYTPTGGQIWLELSQRGDYARIRVADNGIGISKSAQDRLFQEFYRVRTAENAAITGTGLGLSLVKSVAHAHKGKVWVESDSGQGSQFFIELPIASKFTPDEAGM